MSIQNGYTYISGLLGIEAPTVTLTTANVFAW